MKKTVRLNIVCLIALSIGVATGCTKNDNGREGGGGTPGTYVDLGLPSGTKWKTVNEVGSTDVEYDFFTYDEAISRFGHKLPSREQFKELVNDCEWSWSGTEYEIIGPNGNSITLPAAGFRGCSGNVYQVGSSGNYWSSTSDVDEVAWLLEISSDGVYVDINDQCSGLSVRLVQY